MAPVHHAPPSTLYRDEAVFRLEFDRVFARSWFCVGRADSVAHAGQYLAVEVVDQPVLIVRDGREELRAFHNVCRHRGALLCEPGAGFARRAIKCPYHAWAYGLDGTLVGTPNVGKDEVDRDRLGLVPVRVGEWQGCLFVNLSGDAPDLLEWLGDQEDRPVAFERWHLEDLRTGRTTTREVKANWKILVENYEECLHCPTVHPELVDLIPTYRKGGVSDPQRTDWGVNLKPGSSALTATGSTTLPTLPWFSPDEALAVYGAHIFPNAMLDVSGTVVSLATLNPVAVDRTVVTLEYLFAPETIASDNFDPSDVVAFSELVSAQDTAVCERVQRGIASRGFTSGVYPDMDAGLHRFAQRYRAFLDEARP